MRTTGTLLVGINFIIRTDCCRGICVNLRFLTSRSAFDHANGSICDKLLFATIILTPKLRLSRRIITCPNPNRILAPSVGYIFQHLNRDLPRIGNRVISGAVGITNVYRCRTDHIGIECDLAGLRNATDDTIRIRLNSIRNRIRCNHLTICSQFPGDRTIGDRSIFVLSCRDIIYSKLIDDFGRYLSLNIEVDCRGRRRITAEGARIILYPSISCASA